jgi:hypothetical protein
MKTKRTSIFRYPALFAAAAGAFLSAALILGSCQMWSKDDPDLITDTMVSRLESSLLKSHEMLQGSGGTSAGLVPRMLSLRPLTPFGGNPSSEPAAPGTIMKATINRTGMTGGFVGATLTDYPEPAQTTEFTVAARGTPEDVYIITATTTYPATSPAATTVEAYLVKDVTPGDPLGPANGEWTNDDPIVNAEGVIDSKYRITYKTTFRDGSVRDETILYDKTADGIKYAAFDVNGTLDYPAVFVPADDIMAEYSSVVLSTHVRTNTLDFWFWTGTRYQNTVGIRYYTEQAISEGLAVLQGTTVIFEKTLEQVVTLGGTLADSLADLYVGGQNELLAQVVTRQKVTFDASNTALEKTTRTKAVVYDVTGSAALYIEKLNDAAATGDLFADPPATVSLVERQTAIENEPYGLPLVTTSPPTGDLGTLYAAIENQTVSSSDSIIGTGQAYVFTGQNGIVITDPGAGSAYDLTTAGTISAWVKLNSLRPWSVVIRKGGNEDFSDEVYSLQFWSRGNEPVFLLKNPASGLSVSVRAGGLYKTLETGSWYYLVATWNTTTVELYVNGVLSASAANSLYPSPGVPENDGPLIVGAQFAKNSKVYNGYFGLDGIIDSWFVKKTRTSGAAILEEYQRVTGG